MLKFILFSLLLVGSQALADELRVSIDAFDNQPNNCPMFDDKHALMVKAYSSNGGVDIGFGATIDVSISCSTAGAAATVRHTASKTAQRGVAVFDITPRDNGMLQKDTCTVTASSTGIPNDGNFNFTVGFLRVGVKDPARVSAPIIAGKSFNIEGLFVFDDHVPFYDLLLRECTASSDPWIFWYDEDSTDVSTELNRVYPTPSDINRVIGLVDIDTTNNNQCMGMYDGALKNLFTIGSNYNGCKIKLVKEDVTGGNSFTTEGAPVLASTVAVTRSSSRGNNVMLHSGVKPNAPSGISDTIAVYVSTNRGFSWTKSTTITSWTTSATDTGISTTNSDNTRNMVMIKITDGTSTWWRLVRGQ